MSNETINEFAIKLNQMLYNLENEPSLRAPLEAIGYNMENITNGRSHLNTLQEAIRTREREYGEQLIATNAIEEAQEETEATYRAHRTIAQFAFHDDPTAQTQLQLNQPQPQARAQLLQHASNFYQALQENPQLIDTISSQFTTFTAETVTQAQAQLSKTQELWATQQKEMNEAEQATIDRNQAWQEARLWYNSFRKLTDMVYADKPQLKQTLTRKIPA